MVEVVRAAEQATTKSSTPAAAVGDDVVGSDRQCY